MTTKNTDHKEPVASPTPGEVERARWAAGLTQTQAAHRIYVTRRAWQLWEAGDRHMHPAFFELFQIKSQKD